MLARTLKMFMNKRSNPPKIAATTTEATITIRTDLVKSFFVGQVTFSNSCQTWLKYSFVFPTKLIAFITLKSPKGSIYFYLKNKHLSTSPKCLTIKAFWGGTEPLNIKVFHVLSLSLNESLSRFYFISH